MSDIRHNRENTLIIETPEGIEFSLRLAGPVIRCLSWLIDLGCIAVMARIMSYLMSFLYILSPDFAFAGSILIYFIISIGYGIIMEYFWRGQTIGKRLFKLRVMDIQGLNLQLHQVIIRNLLRFVDLLPRLMLVGGIACFMTRYSQRLGDLAANTIVVWSPGRNDPDFMQLMPDKYNSFNDYPHLIARFRKQVSPQESSVALKALTRRNSLDPEARIELFSEIANHFKGITEFPQEAVEGISDEQYIRNVVDVLFRTAERRP